MVDLYSIHERYAKDQQEITAFLRQFHVADVDYPYFASQTKIVDFVPKLLAMTLLLQTTQQGHWARFTLPNEIFTLRFFSSELLPSLGAPERIDELREKVTAIKQRTRDEQQKKRDQESKDEDKDKDEDCFLRLLDYIKEVNHDLQYVRKRLRQFIQA